MQADLDREHAELLLKTHDFGRIGCCGDNRPYVVPISYVYEDGCIYGHTNDGKKLKVMRENPFVCFEVDEIESFLRWRSVICTGRFEELHGVDFKKGCYVGQEVTARMKYRALVKKRLMPVEIEGPTPSPGTPVMFGEEEAGEFRSSADGLGLALLKLDLVEKTGAGEKPLTAGDAILRPRKPDWLA